MQTIVLPGYSKENKIWVDEVATNVNREEIIRPFHWSHWEDESSKFDAKEKASLIAKHIKGDKVNIIAKSIGTLVTSYLYQIISDQLEKVIFCGIPVKDLSKEEIEVIKTCISQKGDKIITFQNSNDPHGFYDEVKDFGNVIKKEASDHNYPYFDEFNEFLNKEPIL